MRHLRKAHSSLLTSPSSGQATTSSLFRPRRLFACHSGAALGLVTHEISIVIEPELQSAILAEYEVQTGIYQDLAAIAAQLLERIIRDAEVQFHSISQRCKSRTSLAGKLSRPNKDYTRLADITDLAAIRVTTYFAEDVDHIAAIVEREFLIDGGNSVDKRKLLDPDRFGYQSLHYIASITPARTRLAEYSRFDDLRFEIQVRSILQHAWAEIEHDLGYKSAVGVPRDIRRRFSRIAGLLELADDEFAAIRRELSEYAASVVQDIGKQPESVGIDNISLRAIVSKDSSALRQISSAVAASVGAALEPTDDQTLEGLVKMLTLVGIRSIADLEQAAASHLSLVRQFAGLWLNKARYESFHDSVGILYLSYVLASESEDLARIHSFLDEAHIGSTDERFELAQRIANVFREASKLT